MFTSSLVNPLIYGIMNPQFRAAFKRALTFRGYGNNQICHGSRWNGTKTSRRLTLDNIEWSQIGHLMNFTQRIISIIERDWIVE